MDQFIRIPPPVAVPHHLNVAPNKRNPPTGPKMQQYIPRLNELDNATDFKHAVINDPQGMFNQLTELLQRNRDLQQDVTSIAQDYAHARRDYASKREQYDILCAIGNAKQMLLWKFVERLQGGKFEGGGLEGAEERFVARQSEADGSVKSPKKEQFGNESPKKEPLGNESPGTVASCLSVMSDQDIFASPEISVAGSATTSLDPSVVGSKHFGLEDSVLTYRRKHSSHAVQALSNTTKNVAMLQANQMVLLHSRSRINLSTSTTIASLIASMASVLSL